MQSLSITAQQVSAIIDEYLINKKSPAMRYAALPPGKCLRSSLFLGTMRSLNILDRRALHIAAAIELIHSFSLVHDDLPALDNDSMRRGKPSCHVIFGEAEAILAGNALLVLAFEIISQKAPDLTHVAAKFVNLMIEGQRYDMQWQSHHNFQCQEIINLYELKTGALFVLPVMLAVKLAGWTSQIDQDVEEYGYNLGVAFQMQDDLSDTAEFNLCHVLDSKAMDSLMQEKIQKAITAEQKLQLPFLSDFVNHVFYGA